MSLVPLDGKRAAWAAGKAALRLAASPASFGSTPRSLDMVSARLYQLGPYLVLKLRTAEPWQARDLDGGAFCLDLHSTRRFGRVCTTGGRRLRLRYELRGTDGRVWRAKLLAGGGKLRRHDSHSLTHSFPFAAIGLHPGPVGRRVFSTRTACTEPAEPNTPCRGMFHMRAGAIADPAPTRCGMHSARAAVPAAWKAPPAGGGADFRRRAEPLQPGHAACAAPVPCQRDLLSPRKAGPAVPALSRRELLAGNELSNHSMRHSAFPSYGDLRATKQAHQGCQWLQAMSLPPAVRAGQPLADRLRARPSNEHRGLGRGPERLVHSRGADAIARRVLRAVHLGAIVVVHDGGGSRSQTVAALPVILRGLHRRGYRVETVSHLLGDRFRWYPS